MKLINKKYLSEYGIWPKNYNFDEVIPYEDITIKIWIEPVVGHYLLEELKTQIANNQLSDENATLLTECLWRYLCVAMAFESLPVTVYKMSEIGLVKGESDNFKSVDTKEYTIIETHLRRQLEALKEETIKFLCSRCESFPLLDTSICSGCGCPCNNDKAPVEPNPLWQIYSTPKKDVDLR